MLSELNISQLHLQQTRLVPKTESVAIFVRQHNFHAGTIDLTDKTFISVSRSSKNIFHLFGGGLGLNSEILFIILPHYSIEQIIIPFENQLLKTLASKWRRLGISSPYCNDAVDKQIILSFDFLNMDDTNKYTENTLVRKPDYQLALNF